MVYNITGLAPGTYYLNVHDSKGCFALNNFEIEIPNAALLTGTLGTVVHENCFDANDGSITITGIGGGTTVDANGNPVANPYQITLNYTTDTATPPNDTSVYVPINNGAGANTHVFSTLGGEFYKIRLKDVNGCPLEFPVIINDGVNYTPDVDIDFECPPVNTNTLGVTVTVLNTVNNGLFNPLSEYRFTLGANPPQTSPVFSSATYPELLVPGPHTIMVNSVSTTCDKPVNFSIQASDLDPLVLSVEQGGLNEIVANINNPDGTQSGTSPYTFYFNGVNNGNDNTYVYFQSGTYLVEVIDENGCYVSAPRYFEFIPIDIPDTYTPGGGGGWSPNNTSIYPNLVTRIYDRYGRLIATLPEGQKWYGKYEGKDLPSGDYWYVLKVDKNNDKEYVGHFTLYR